MNGPSTQELALFNSVRCLACGVAIPCVDPAHSEFFACKECGQYFLAKNDGTTQARGACDIREKTEPILPIGKEGRLNGANYVVVGFARKRDTNDEAEWTEYYLHNNNKANYDVLVESDGHWMLVTKKNIADFSTHAGYMFSDEEYWANDKPNKKFKHYTRYQFKIFWMAGEFDWDILSEARNMVVDEYAHHPHLIVIEEMGNQKDLYWGSPLQPSQVSSAFSIDSSRMPYRIGNGPAPTSIKEQISQSALTRFTILLLVLAAVAQFALSGFNSPKVVFSEIFLTQPDSSSWATLKPMISTPFAVTNSGAVDINLASDVDNDWLEANVVLVNDKTGKTYEATRAIEYYHGYDGGESWSEGDKSTDIVFAEVPEGTYHLNIYPFCESSNPHSIVASVEQSTSLPSNMIMMMLAALCYPAIMYIVSWARDSVNNYNS